MKVQTTANGITSPSRIAYYRSLEDQGNHTDQAFYEHMRLKLDDEFRERQNKAAYNLIMTHFYNDPEYKKKLNMKRAQCYIKKRAIMDVLRVML